MLQKKRKKSAFFIAAGLAVTVSAALANTAWAMTGGGSSPGYTIEEKEVQEEGQSEGFMVMEVEAQNNLPVIGTSEGYSMCGEVAGQAMESCEIPPPQEAEDNGEPPEPEPQPAPEQNQNNSNAGGGSSGSSGGAGYTVTPEEETKAPTEQQTQTQTQTETQENTPSSKPEQSPEKTQSQEAQQQEQQKQQQEQNNQTPRTSTPDSNKSAYGPWPQINNEIITMQDGPQRSVEQTNKNSNLRGSAGIGQAVFLGEFYGTEFTYDEDICTTLPADRKRTEWEKQKTRLVLSMTIIFNGGMVVYVLQLLMGIYQNPTPPRRPTSRKKRH